MHTTLLRKICCCVYGDSCSGDGDGDTQQVEYVNDNSDASLDHVINDGTNSVVSSFPHKTVIKGKTNDTDWVEEVISFNMSETWSSSSDSETVKSSNPNTNNGGDDSKDEYDDKLYDWYGVNIANVNPSEFTYEMGATYLANALRLESSVMTTNELEEREPLLLAMFGQYEKAIKFIDPQHRKYVIDQYEQKKRYYMSDNDIVYETKRNAILKEARETSDFKVKKGLYATALYCSYSVEVVSKVKQEIIQTCKMFTGVGTVEKNDSVDIVNKTQYVYGSRILSNIADFGQLSKSF
jgi:hypothetical protein